MAIKLKLASDIVLRISTVFILQALILLMISHYEFKEKMIPKNVPKVSTEQAKNTAKAKPHSTSNP